MQECKHQMPINQCGFCTPKEVPKPRVPRPSPREDVFETNIIDPHRMAASGITVIHTDRGREDYCFSLLGERTTFVHIDGTPFLWAIEKILSRAPNLRTLQVIPSMKRKLSEENHLRLCKERNVDVRTGHVRPELAWEPGDNRNKSYDKIRNFFRNITDTQKKLFDELLVLGIDGAVMTARFFCLNGEEYQPQRVVAEEFGYTHESHVSMWINGVMRYLDPVFPTGERSIQIAAAMGGRVARLRRYLQSAEEVSALCRRLGVPSLPVKMPLSRLELYERLLVTQRSGELSRLGREHPRSHEALTLRYGFDSADKPQFRTLEEVGQLMKVTRQRVQQLEEHALEKLSLTEWQ